MCDYKCIYMLIKRTSRKTRYKRKRRNVCDWLIRRNVCDWLISVVKCSNCGFLLLEVSVWACSLRDLLQRLANPSPVLYLMKTLRLCSAVGREPYPIAASLSLCLCACLFVTPLAPSQHFKNSSNIIATILTQFPLLSIETILGSPNL